MSFRSFLPSLVSGMAIVVAMQSVTAANHSIRLLGRVTGLQSINGNLETKVRINDPYVLTLSYDPSAPVDHDSNSGDACNGINLSISLQAVYLDSPSWSVASLNDPEGALIIENNSLSTTGTQFDSIRALATLDSNLGDSFPVDSNDAEPQFGRFEVEVGGRFISQVEQLPTTRNIL
jgi:hypothetical protein